MSEPHSLRLSGQQAMDESKQLFRIVIGAFPEPELAASASCDLRRGGLDGGQVCLIGREGNASLARKASGAEPGAAGDKPGRRRIAGQPVEVSAPGLFDLIWHDSASPELPLAPWMTKAQSKAILDSIRGGALVLLVSATSASEQVRASRIQLNHNPSMVQAYSFVS